MAHQCTRCGRPLPDVRIARDGANLCPVCRTGNGSILPQGGKPDPDILIADVDLQVILRDETVEAACPGCGFCKNIPSKYAGMRVKCPQCALVFRALGRRGDGDTPQQSLFRCASCGMERAVPPGFLGKRVRCPRCKNISLVSDAIQISQAMLKHDSSSSGDHENTPERRTRERVFVQNVDMVMGLLGDFKCRDLSGAGVGFFPGRGDWDFRKGSTINFDLAYRSKPLIRNLAARVTRINASMVGCSFQGLSNLQEQLISKLMKSQRFQISQEQLSSEKAFAAEVKQKARYSN